MNTKAILLLFAVFAATAVDAQKKLVCYWFGKMDTGEINPHICTHIVYSFLGVDSYGNLNHIHRNEWEALQHIGRIVALRNQRPDLKVLAAVGGYNEPMQIHWSTMAANPEARGNFARNVLDFIRRANLNGIDIDWEYPNMDGTTPHDKGNFILLLQDLKQTLGHEFSLSVAIGAGEWRTSLSYNIPEIFAISDFVNVMTYDLHGAWQNTAGIHASLFRSVLDNTPANLHESVEFLMHSGANRDKLIVGIPSYGIAFDLADANRNGVGAPVNGGAGDLDYRDICQRTRSEALTYRWEETQRVPYAFSGNFWIGYDDVRSVIEKAHYIRSNNYGGGMFWALDNDDFGNACGEGRFPLIANVYNIVMA